MTPPIYRQPTRCWRSPTRNRSYQGHVFGELYALTMRTGGEILFERSTWQALYGKS
ncbi:MAG: hypothetical protein BroJett021_23810 [Chloroflexota bacterium]|nr:hypothetical protein [Caldilinea sp.]GIK73393.1 MAG: hypothetical protein BroJett021_23810 [Chloroflexota bacterium]